MTDKKNKLRESQLSLADMQRCYPVDSYLTDEILSRKEVSRIVS